MAERSGGDVSVQQEADTSSFGWRDRDAEDIPQEPAHGEEYNKRSELVGSERAFSDRRHSYHRA